MSAEASAFVESRPAMVNATCVPWYGHGFSPQSMRFSSPHFAERIVESIVHARQRGRIQRSGELVELITAAVPTAARFTASALRGADCGRRS